MAPKGKQHRLTLSQLASYDDILTDALVDHVYFWTIIRKNRAKYQLTRGLSEEDICHILRHEVVCSKDVQQAEKDLLKLPGIRKLVERLTNDREKEDFKRHMRKYICIWLPDCPWEVTTTNRYTIDTKEASATARRFIKKGETIKYLCGNLVAMTPEEEKDLDLTRRDFSIVMSSRKKTPSLFLGPARFANHDCNANARLVTTGNDGMQVVASKNINLDEEITVTYGEGYFGVNNCECLCMTCEIHVRNGWGNGIAGEKTSDRSTPAIEIDNVAGPYTFRNKRKYIPGENSSGASTPDRPAKRSGSISSGFLTPNGGFPQKRKPGRPRKLREETLSKVELEARISELLPDPQSLMVPSEEDLKGHLPQENSMTEDANYSSQDPIVPPQERPYGLLDSTFTPTLPTLLPNNLIPCYEPSAAEPRRDSLDIPSTTTTEPCLSQQASHVPSDVDSVFDRNIAQSPSPASTLGRSDRALKPWNLETEREDTEEASLVELPLNDDLALDILNHAEPDNESDISDLSSLSSTELDRIAFESELPSKTTRKPFRKHLQDPQLTPSTGSPAPRYPGDYMRTLRLLAEPYSRWVDCETCSASWVQSNSYFTLKECPRCERHSKLYGYRWPKTEPAKGDKEGRVMDHRTVHRFISRGEEKKLKRKGRGVVGWETETPPPEGTEDEKSSAEGKGTPDGIVYDESRSDTSESSESMVDEGAFMDDADEEYGKKPRKKVEGEGLVKEKKKLGRPRKKWKHLNGLINKGPAEPMEEQIVLQSDNTQPPKVKRGRPKKKKDVVDVNDERPNERPMEVPTRMDDSLPPIPVQSDYQRQSKEILAQFPGSELTDWENVRPGTSDDGSIGSLVGL